MPKIRTSTRLRIFLALQITVSAAEGLDHPCRFSVASGFEKWMNDDGSLRFPSYWKDGNVWRKNDNAASSTSKKKKGFCQFLEESEDVVCKDAIDYTYLKKMENKQIRALFVDSYNTRKNMSTPRFQNFGRSNLWKMTGELSLRGIDVEVSTMLDVQETGFDRFSLNGEVFSNKIIKAGWKYMGRALWTTGGKFTTVEAVMISKEPDNGWSLNANCIILENAIVFHGIILYISNLKSEVRFEGRVSANVTRWNEIIFDGHITLSNINIKGYFRGRAVKYLNMDITIPEKAFSNMYIQNLVFRDSHFFGDFHSDCFEGINQLQTISFYRSRMEFMPKYDTIFRGSSLKAIYIEDCATFNITTGHKCILKNLELLSFKGSGFLEISDSSFGWLSCSNLSYLNLRDTNFKVQCNGPVLLPVSRTLRYLDLSYSTLRQERSLSEFLRGSAITHLSLAGLDLKSVPVTALYSIQTTLQYLSLRKNNFEKIPGKNILSPVLYFPFMPALKELDLHNCRINYIEKFAFGGLKKLEKVDLSCNSILNLHDGWTGTRPGIVYMNLSNNDLVENSWVNLGATDRTKELEPGTFDKLETLDLSNSNFFRNNYIINSSKSLKYLSLCNSGLQNLNNSLFKVLTNLKEIDLSSNPHIGKIPSFFHLKRMKYLKILHLAHNKIVDARFDQLPMTLEYVDLSYNHIKEISSEFLNEMTNLNTLILSHNSLSDWPKNLPLFASSLEKIYLDNNKIEELSPDILETMGSLDEFTLANNPFLCGCYVLDFVKRLRNTSSGYYTCPEFVKDTDIDMLHVRPRLRLSHETLINSTKRKVYLYKGQCAKIADWSERDYICYSPSVQNVFSFLEVDEDLDECHNKTEITQGYFQWFYLSLIFTLLTCFAVVILWWKWWNFRIFGKMLKTAAVVGFGDDLEYPPRTFDYDAFISYAESDREWVTEKLIPKLEALENIKICLHERDFQVGLSILENIATSIDKSKNIILIISQAFAKSQWCQYEMHLAYHRLLETRRGQMILILLENIPRYKRPRTLHYLMVSKTYIKWPCNAVTDNDIKVFWNRLFKALYLNDS